MEWLDERIFNFLAEETHWWPDQGISLRGRVDKKVMQLSGTGVIRRSEQICQDMLRWFGRSSDKLYYVECPVDDNSFEYTQIWCSYPEIGSSWVSAANVLAVIPEFTSAEVLQIDSRGFLSCDAIFLPDSDLIFREVYTDTTNACVECGQNLFRRIGAYHGRSDYGTTWCILQEKKHHKGQVETCNNLFQALFRACQLSIIDRTSCTVEKWNRTTRYNVSNGKVLDFAVPEEWRIIS